MFRPLVPVEFMYRLISEGNNSKHRHGRVGFDALYLDEDALGYGQVSSTLTREQILCLQFDPDFESSEGLNKFVSKDGVLVICPINLSASVLEREINRRRSILEAEARRKELQQAGLEDQIRTELCLVCESDIDLSSLESIVCPP